MNSAAYVKAQAEELKKAGHTLQWVAWTVALLCVGWAYVFGARGEQCTPGNRRAYFKSKGAAHPTIASKCQVIREDNPKENCNGCKWYPEKQRTLFFDCRGFTYWVLLLVFGWKLQGAGATSQWNTAKNWKAKGPIKTMPADTLVCLFQAKGSTMAHTGFGYNGETVECQNGVQYSKTRSEKWTHWAVPACIDGTYTPPKEENKTVNKTIRKGNKGELVKKCQQLLQKHGYDLGICGVDGDFGVATEKAVKQFQKDNGLTADGVVGEKTWEALEKDQQYFRVTVSHVIKSTAEEIVKKYGGEISAE